MDKDRQRGSARTVWLCDRLVSPACSEDQQDPMPPMHINTMYNTNVKMKWNDLCFRPWFCIVRLYWAGATWANEMNFVMNHVPGAGSITQPAVDQQSSVLPLCYGRPLHSCTISHLYSMESTPILSAIRPRITGVLTTPESMVLQYGHFMY